MVIERIKFYADVSDSVKNKFFCFRINSIFDLENRVRYWTSKFYIRAMWYECVEDGNVVNNEKIDLVSFTDFRTVKFLPK